MLTLTAIPRSVGWVQAHRSADLGTADRALRRAVQVIAYSQRYHYPNPWIGDGGDYAGGEYPCGTCADGSVMWCDAEGKSYGCWG